jgi:hypothetical protein
MLSRIKRYGAKSGSSAVEETFIFKKLGVLMNGELGEDPDTGLISEPISPPK